VDGIIAFFVLLSLSFLLAMKVWIVRFTSKEIRHWRPLTCFYMFVKIDV
jgi:hypothetical protein